MVQKLGRFGKQIINTLEAVKYGAREEWRRPYGRIV
jgi:hypothetical protein